MYDLSADFYVKSSDSQPKYTVLMGSYYPKTINEMEDLGFIEDANSDPGYLDYCMEADQKDLERFTQHGYESEMLDVLFMGYDWERIRIRAVEVEVLDDNGSHPSKGMMVGDTFVHYHKTEANYKITIAHGNPFEDSGVEESFTLSVGRFKQLLGVITLMEGLAKMQKMVSEKGWTYKEFQSLLRFEKRIRLFLNDITPAFGMGDHIAFTLKGSFEKRSEIKDYDPIVLFVNKSDEGLNYWFDRAHVAETLAPMSLWEIKDEEREKWTNWLGCHFGRSQLKSLLIEYADAIEFLEKPETT